LAAAVTIVVSPLTTAVLLLFFGKWLSSRRWFGIQVNVWAGIVATLAIGRAFVAAVFMFLDLIKQPEAARTISVHVFDWINVGGFHANVNLLVDQLSVIMVLVVTGIGTLIHLYSIGYMKGDPRFARFFAYLNLFAFSMLLLVLADNVLLLYVGWEGVGLCSYLLIGFWFERKAASDAAKKAFIVNRIGDFSFLLGILLLATTVGGLTIGQINGAAGGMTAGIATLASLLLLGGAAGKSAQIPLYVWLPDAMEGPTPASALIHAATMVTAGVYLIARLHPVFVASGGAALMVVAWVGALTALWAALMAATEYDIKRVLAYSTVSQLGYMFLANGVGAYSAGIFHLITHAFFKALMFMGAGSVMHSLAGETDMRKMGGLRKIMPITGFTFMMGWLAISGVIPFAGFFSKDAILASTWQDGQYVLWAIGVATAFLTAFYMSRLYFRVFEGEVKVPEGVHAHESPWTMTLPLIVLAVGAVGAGVINFPGSLRLEHFLEPVLGHAGVPEGLLPWVLGGAALMVGFVGIGLAHFLYRTERGADLRTRLRPDSWLDKLIKVSRDKFYVDELYGRALVLPGKDLADFAAYTIDARVIDGIVMGTGRLVGGSSDGLRHVQTGYVRNYAATFLVGVVVVVCVLVARIGLS
jgi:NADH-quinone oxidoreductase subunit L